MDTVSKEAEALHEEGRSAGSKGDLKGAVELLIRAHQLAPEWAYPPYDLAFTYLLNGELEEAEKWYAFVDELEPRGFFTAKTFLHTIRRERRGELSDGFSRAFAMLEWAPEDQQRQVLQQIVVRVPTFAPAWKQLASLTEDVRERLELLDRGLTADADDETWGMLVLNRALTLTRLGQGAHARQQLLELIEDTRCTVGVAALAKATLGGTFGGNAPD